MKNKVKKAIFAFLWLFFLPINIEAQDISFEASVSSNRIVLGSSFQLTITITGVKDTAPVKLPEIDGMESRYLGPSTRISIVNGKYSSSVAHIYTFIPLKTGKFQIPSISTTLSGKTYKTDPIDIEVKDEGASPGVQQDKASSRSLSLKNKVFLVIEVPKAKLYVNEKSSLTFKLFIGGVSLRDIELPSFKHTGFTVDQFQKPKQYRENRGGKAYEVVELKTFIYPTRAGKLEIGPASLKSNILIRSSERRRRGGLNDFFEDDFFMGSFFGRHKKRPITVESNKLIIEVLPLPVEGKPENFSGAVGRFDFEASASPAEVKVGDPVTLRMTARGNGNLKAVTMPALDAEENFKLYDPQIKEEEGIKSLEQVVIPRSDKVKGIPEIGFSYFDVEEKKYKTITRGPFSLKVIKPNEQEDFKILQFDNETKAAVKEQLGRDIIFIKDRPGSFQEINYHLYRSPGFLVLVLASLIAWSGILLAYKRTHKLKTDIVYARRLRAPKQARKGLDEAMQLIEQKQPKKFYNTVFKTIQDYFGNKFHLSSGAITYETVENKLNSGKIKPEILEILKSVFAECDMVRYASAEINENEMKDNLKKTQKIIDHIERYFK